ILHLGGAVEVAYHRPTIGDRRLGCIGPAEDPALARLLAGGATARHLLLSGAEREHPDRGASYRAGLSVCAGGGSSGMAPFPSFAQSPRRAGASGGHECGGCDALCARLPLLFPDLYQAV